LQLQTVRFDGDEAEVQRAGRWYEWGSDDITDLLKPGVDILQADSSSRMTLHVGTLASRGQILTGGPWKGKPAEYLLRARINEVISQMRKVNPNLDISQIDIITHYNSDRAFSATVEHKQ
jgi:hypothetical protein